MGNEHAGNVRYGIDLGLPVVEENVFRNVVGHFASGVTVITTADGDDLFGTTVSAVSSLSSDPPMMLICLNRSSVTHDAVARSGRYAINILSAAQGDLARTFARKGDDKFAGVGHTISPRGLPLLAGALASIECVVDETAVGGTHTIFLGRVVAAEAQDGEPLAYYRGTFGNLESALETAAYEGTREWVLHRRTPLGETIDVSAVASSLRLEPKLVDHALLRLATESLVEKREGGHYVPIAMTPTLVDKLYGDRLTIATGVIERYLTGASDEQLDRIRRLSDQVLAAVPTSAETLEQFLELNLDYHAAIVDLAGSRKLTASFRALNVTTVWRETYEAGDWERQLGPTFVPRLTTALEQRDVSAAQRIACEQVEFVKEGAKAVIAAHGGAV
ncbi:FCD domain-containing protein [Microbacterium sp. dk485]|uniref:flavin reductase n=1 Tax=Microbacterium TaxID=33882 RepID=UPI001072F106|nr:MULTISPECIES: flavin reductase [Microbacterium]TFV84878.1 FCD domain-containing protein [Microbacterium sp. dk485]TXK11674.1 FCD domain-containing protein [Microbacterium wangchenii]